jgi:F-type H+-transporting ATPase subunit b
MFAMTAVLFAAEHAEDVKAKNPIVPESDEIFWGAICFALVFALLAWKAWPAIKKALQDREDRIKADLERAEEAKSEAETSLADYQRQLADARNEAGRIIEEARLAADQVRKDLMARAETEAAELRVRAQDDIRLATERAMADLQGRVAELTIELAEKVVERNLDRDTQIALIESYINQVGSR